MIQASHGQEGRVESLPIKNAGSEEPPRVSIVVPCRRIDRYVRECVQACLRLRGVRVEVFVLPDASTDEEVRDFPPSVRIIPTGPVLPGAKRNLGTHFAPTEIVAYIDADAYPREDWLERALSHLARPEIGAVGGPGLTPPEDTYLQRLSGEIYASPLMGRLNRIRYVVGRQQQVPDLHSCNFVAKSNAVLDAGGWSEAYWPGEDTLLCLAMTARGRKILYAPDVQVYHHRRSSLRAHLRQVWNFGVHRGYFFKRYPANSRKALYVMPSLLLLYPIGLALLWAAGLADVWVGLLPLLAYAALLVANSFSARPKRLIPLVSIGVAASHLTYGAGFLKGLLSSDVSKRVGVTT